MKRRLNRAFLCCFEKEFRWKGCSVCKKRRMDVKNLRKYAVILRLCIHSPEKRGVSLQITWRQPIMLAASQDGCMHIVVRSICYFRYPVTSGDVLWKENIMIIQEHEIGDKCALESGVELLLSEEMCSTTEGRLSLYGVCLDGDWFYAVSAVSEASTESAAELLGCDRERAERIYGRLLHGGVTPEFLHDIVYDQMDSFYAESEVST